MVSSCQSVPYITGAVSFVLGQTEINGSLSPWEWQELALEPLWLESKASSRARDDGRAEPRECVPSDRAACTAARTYYSTFSCTEVHSKLAVPKSPN